VILRELFDKPAKWVEVDNDMGFAYQFQTKDGKGYEVTLDVDDDFVYEVIFADEAGRIDLTGAGNAAEVIGTVIAILKAHVKEHNLPDLSFSAEAKEPSRVRLYTTLVNKLSGDMGYEVEAINHMGMKSWKLTKKQNENINELFNKPLKWWTDKEQMDSARYGFTTTDDRNFSVEFDQEPNGEWEFVFMDANGRMDLTGGGGAVEIFATVKEVALHFFKKYKPKDPVYFQADTGEPSRVKMYQRAAKMISSELPAYKVITNKQHNAYSFLIVPADSDEWDWQQSESIQVNELLDQPLPYQIRDDDDDWKAYNFKTSDGRKFTVVMDLLPQDYWDIAFTDNNMSSSKTGRGSAVEIFATVGAIIKEFIKKTDPRMIKFSAIDNEPSRVKLYKRLAAMGAKTFPQYNLDVRQAAGGADFILKKEEQQEENLNELFNQPLKYNKVVPRASDSGRKIMWRFDTPKGNRIQVEAYKSQNYNKWEFGFYDFEDDNPHITGKGDAAQVFATVIAIGEEFVKDVKPDMVEWFADNDEPSRVSLYDRMVKTLARRMPNYEIKSQDTGGSFQRYVMIRKDAEEESMYESIERDLEEFISQNQLGEIERGLDGIFKKNNIDVQFTRHFFDRLNDERNVRIGGSEITSGELVRLFKQEQKRWGKSLQALPDNEEGVMKDKKTNINVPFIKKNTPDSQPDKVITKTIMKKPNFKSDTPFYPVESKQRLTLRSLFEAPSKTAAFAFGRLNPATNGHELLVNEIVAQDADSFLYLSDRPAALPKDPLEPKEKQAWAQASFPQIQVKLANNALLAADELYKMGYTNLIYLEGEPKMGKVIQKYNGQETAKHFFNFDNVNLVQLTRDPDAEGATGMSATKLRQTVIDDDFEAFTQGITKPAQRVAKEMFEKLRGILTQDESVEEAHGNSSIYDKCWKGYHKKSGATRGSKGSCVKNESAAGPPSGDYAAYKKSIGASSAAGPSASKDEPKEPDVKWTRGLFDHIFTDEKPGNPFIDPSSRKAFIPMVASTINILSGENKRTMYGAHVLGIKDIPKLIALQGKKGKQISAFTTDEYGDLETGLWTEGGIIAIIKGVAMSGGPGDIMSKVDKQGRRVVDFGPRSPAMNNIGKVADSKAFQTAIQEIINARVSIAKELQSKFSNYSEIDGKTKHEAIKKYMDAVNATLTNNKKVMQKAMTAWAENQGKKWSNNTEYGEYDEIVMGNFKIIKLFVKPNGNDNMQQTYQFRDYFENNDFPFPVEYVRDTNKQHLKRFLDQNVEESLEEFKIVRPDSKDTMGITRDKMPQIKKENYAELINFLKENGATYSKKSVPAKQLKPIQKEFSDAGVEKSIEKRKIKKPIIAAQDGYIIDGHHRWLAALNLNSKVDILEFNTSGKELLQLVLDFPKTYFKPIHEFDKKKKPAIKENDDDFDDDGNRIPIGADEAPKWTRSLFDHLFIKKGNKYDPERPYTKGDKEVFIPLVPAMIDKLVGGPTELYGAHSTGTQNLDRLIQMQNKKGKQISVFTTDREGQLSDGVWGGGGVVAILRGNAYASSTGDIMSVVDKQGRRVLDIGPSGDLMNLEDNEDFLYGDDYPNMYKEIRNLQRSITAKIEDIIDERGDVEGKEKAAFIKEYIDGLYAVIPKYRKTFSKLMVGWAQSQNKKWQEVHGTYDEVVMGNYKIVHIFLVGKDRQKVSQLEDFMREKAMGYVRKPGEGMVEDPAVKNPFLEQLYKAGKLKLIDKTEEDFPYQVLDTYMKRNKEMGESLDYARNYSLGKLLETASGGTSSAGNIATVVNPPKGKKKSKTHNPDGTIKNALDSDDNLMGGTLIRR